MRKRRPGKTGMVVSEIGMGTMTFGASCDEKESFRIMDRAHEAGVDLFDTAELYPVPPDPSWVHRTEEIVGRWMKTRSRDSVILATKVAGPGHGWFSPPVRMGKTGLDRHHILRAACEASLRRLDTDYIDLYQTHWPDHDLPYEETMEVLTQLIQSGKIRYAGCSNETPWGLMKSLQTSETHGLARYETIQNNFSLLNRRFEDALAEVCRRESVSLLAYSPLAGGVLTGKYGEEPWPENARFTQYRQAGPRQQQQSNRFVNERTLESTRRFAAIAREYDMSPTTLAVAWSKQHDFVASTLVGATSLEQLDEILLATDVELGEEILSKIDRVSKEILYPMG